MVGVEYKMCPFRKDMCWNDRCMMWNCRESECCLMTFALDFRCFLNRYGGKVVEGEVTEGGEVDGKKDG